MNRLRPLHILYVVLGMTLLLRLVTLSAPYWNLDEAVSALVGKAISEGGQPYRDAVDHRGPLTYYVYALVFEVMGAVHMQGVHILYIGVVMGMIVAVYLMGKHIHSGWIGAIAASLLAIYSWAYHPTDVWAAHTEWLMSLCTAWAIWGLWRGDFNIQTCIWVGLLLGLAVLSKQVAVWECGVVAVTLWEEARKKQLSWPSAWGYAVLSGAMTCIPLLLFSFYAYQQGIWQDWLDYGWRYNISNYLPIITWEDRFIGAIRLLGDFLWDKPLLWIGMGLFIRKYWRTHKKEKYETGLLAWALFTTLGACMSGRAFGHYMIQVLVPWSLMAGIGWSTLFKVAVRRVAWVGIVLILLLPTTLRMYRMEWPQAYQISSLATYIQLQSRPEEKLFVWGMYPELYLEADRAPASRFIFCNMVSGMIPWENLDGQQADWGRFPGAADSLHQDLQQDPPSWIVDTSPDSTFAYHHFPISQHPRLADWLHTHYTLDSTSLGRFSGYNFFLYRRE